MNELLVVTPNGYKTSKLYSVVPADGTGDLTWVRNTTATRVNSSGLIESVGANVPRLDYTGGVTCPCILVEPLRTNLVLYSEQFDNAYWTKDAVVLVSWIDQGVSPDGATTADKLIPDTTTARHRFRMTDLTSRTAGTYTVSGFFKADGVTRGAIMYELAGAVRYTAEFDLATGVFTRDFTNNAPPSTTFNYQLFSNGWVRVSLTFTMASNSLIVTHFGASSAAAVSAGGFPSYLGNSTDAVYIWGAQLEAGATASAYIPTVASIQTRNADVATVTTPVGITSLIETYEDNTTNVVNPIPVTYQMSEGRIAKVVGL